LKISFTHYVFQTLTYDRKNLCRHKAWWSCSKDTTNYIQKVRRYFGNSNHCEFIRVIEPHKDWYPHVHLLLYFRRPLRVENGRYFDDRLFYNLQKMWGNGFSKPEVLRKPNAAFSYVLKYFLKQLSIKTTKSNDPPIDKIWRLKGKRVVWFALPIRILAWSGGMQKLYLNQQLLKLVLRKNTPHKLSSPLTDTTTTFKKSCFVPLIRKGGLGGWKIPQCELSIFRINQ